MESESAIACFAVALLTGGDRPGARAQALFAEAGRETSSDRDRSGRPVTALGFALSPWVRGEADVASDLALALEAVSSRGGRGLFLTLTERDSFVRTAVAPLGSAFLEARARAGHVPRDFGPSETEGRTATGQRRRARAGALAAAVHHLARLENLERDARAGRLWIPVEELVHLGLDPARAVGPTAGPILCRALPVEIERARSELGKAAPLASDLDLGNGLAAAALAAAVEARLAALESRTGGIVGAGLVPLRTLARIGGAQRVRRGVEALRIRAFGQR